MTDDSFKKSRLEIAISRIHKYTLCPKCSESFEKPTLAACNHVFCKSCIENVFNHKVSTTCPVCKRKITRRSIRASKRMTDIVSGVRHLIQSLEADKKEFGISTSDTAQSFLTVNSNESRHSNKPSVADISTNSSSVSRRRRQQKGSISSLTVDIPPPHPIQASTPAVGLQWKPEWEPEVNQMEEKVISGPSLTTSSSKRRERSNGLSVRDIRDSKGSYTDGKVDKSEEFASVEDLSKSTERRESEKSVVKKYEKSPRITERQRRKRKSAEVDGQGDVVKPSDAENVREEIKDLRRKRKVSSYLRLSAASKDEMMEDSVKEKERKPKSDREIDVSIKEVQRMDRNLSVNVLTKTRTVLENVSKTESPAQNSSRTVCMSKKRRWSRSSSTIIPNVKGNIRRNTKSAPKLAHSKSSTFGLPPRPYHPESSDDSSPMLPLAQRISSEFRQKSSPRTPKEQVLTPYRVYGAHGPPSANQRSAERILRKYSRKYGCYPLLPSYTLKQDPSATKRKLSSKSPGWSRHKEMKHEMVMSSKKPLSVRRTSFTLNRRSYSPAVKSHQDTPVKVERRSRGREKIMNILQRFRSRSRSKSRSRHPPVELLNVNPLLSSDISKREPKTESVAQGSEEVLDESIMIPPTQDQSEITNLKVPLRNERSDPSTEDLGKSEKDSMRQLKLSNDGRMLWFIQEGRVVLRVTVIDIWHRYQRVNLVPSLTPDEEDVDADEMEANDSTSHRVRHRRVKNRRIPV